MPIVRRLSDVDDVTFSTGLGGVDGLTHGTVAFLFRPLAAYDSTDRTLLAAYDLAGTQVGKIALNTANKIVWWSGGSGGTGPTLTAGDFYALVVRKQTGTTNVRFSLKNESTGIWGHSATSGTVADWASFSGGSLHTYDLTFSWGPGCDYAAMAVWANQLPWAADTFGDAEIEAANLGEHLDNWVDAAPSSGWGFDVPDANYSIEDFTLNRADETSVGAGTPVDAADLDFQYETTTILQTVRNFLRNVATEPGTGDPVWDLSETQGTAATLGTGNTSSGGFTEMLRWQRTVGDTVGAATISTQVSIDSISAQAACRWRVVRLDSSGVEQATSGYSGEHTTAGIKVSTLVLSTTWAAGDRLALAFELRKAGGGGNRSAAIDVNNADSFADFELAAVLPANVAAAIGLSLAVAPTSATVHDAAAGVGLAVQLAATVQAPAGTGLVSGAVSANPATLSCAVGERLICIAFSRSGGTVFGVTPDAGGGTWTSRVAEATLPGNDLARRSLGVAELVPTGAVTDGLFTAAWSADPTDAIWLRVQEGGAFGFAAAAVADSDTALVASLATGDTASVPAGDLLLVAAAAVRDGGAAGIGWATTAVNPGLVGGGNLLLDAYAGKGAGGNAGAGGYLILDGQPAGVRADTIALPGGDADKRITVALVVWSTGVTSVPEVAAAVGLTVAVGGATQAEHEAAAGVALAVALAPTAQADHDVAADVPLSVATAAATSATHAAAASVPLSVALTGVVAAPVVGQAEVATAIQLGLTVAAAAQAEHHVAAAVPLAVDLAASTSAPILGPANAAADIPLTLALAPAVQADHDVAAAVTASVAPAATVSAPGVGEANVATAIPLAVSVAGQVESAYRVGTVVPLAVALVGSTATTRDAQAAVNLALVLAPVGGTDRDVAAALALTLTLAATTATQILERHGYVGTVPPEVATVTQMQQRTATATEVMTA
jgi:hypothetical protein